MILGISSYAFSWSLGIHGYTDSPDQTFIPWDENDLFDFMASHHVNCLQIADNLPLHLFTKERLENLKNKIEVANIRIELGARKLTPNNLQTYLELAAFFRSPLLRFVIDGDQYEPAPKEVIAILKDYIPELQKQNLQLGIENHDRLKAKEFASIIEACGTNHIGICLDTVNSMGAGEGLEYVLDVLGPYIINLHIKEFRIQRLFHKMGFEITGTPAGQGQADIPGILEKLDRFGRCQSGILEQWVPYTTDLENTIDLEKKWAETSLDYLKSLSYFTNL